MVRGDIRNDRTYKICVEAHPRHLVRVFSSRTPFYGYALLNCFTVDAVDQETGSKKPRFKDRHRYSQIPTES